MCIRVLFVACLAIQSCVVPPTLISSSVFGFLFDIRPIYAINYFSLTFCQSMINQMPVSMTNRNFGKFAIGTLSYKSPKNIHDPYYR